MISYLQVTTCIKNLEKVSVETTNKIKPQNLQSMTLKLDNNTGVYILFFSFIFRFRFKENTLLCKPIYI